MIGARRAGRGRLLLFTLLGVLIAAAVLAPGAPSTAQNGGGYESTGLGSRPGAPSSSPPFTSAWRPGTLEVTVLDVGQGDGIGIRCPDGRLILVDAGPASGPTLAWLAAVETSPGTAVVDALVLTHPHLDHIGGALDVLRSRSVRRVYDCGYPHTTAAYRRLLEAIEADSRIDYHQPRTGDRLDWGRGVAVRVLHPDTLAYEDLNNTSIVLHVAAGRQSFLLTGDAEREAEARILDAARAEGARGSASPRATVLKVGHHGSRSSTTQRFLEAVDPVWAAISCGNGNRYGHPKAEILERLERAGVRTLRTDTDGWISFLVDADTLTVRTARGGAHAG